MMIYVNNRSPKKLRMQRKKQLAKKQEQYQEWLTSLEKLKPNFGKPGIKNIVALQSGKRFVRETPHYDSLETIGGVATKPIHGNVYTGDKMKGIGTLHKSNAVPIFTDEEAKDQANMRR